MKPYRFVHLNVHSHYSINAGSASIRELVDAAIRAYCLVAIVQHDMRLDRSTYEVLQILSMERAK